MKHTTHELITIAKRENNTKRSFLLVNPLQGKHLPVSPRQTFQLVQELSLSVFAAPMQGSLLIIGFAETATAIGALLASYAPFSVAYLHTTREPLADFDCLFFSEEHSHATEQKLCRHFLDHQLSPGTHIIFAEDEVTTGQTIENIIAALERAYPTMQLQYSIASLLNGMTAAKRAELQSRGIYCHFLSSVPDYDYPAILERYQYHPQLCLKANGSDPNWHKITINGLADPRLGVQIQDYQKGCQKFAEQLIQQSPDLAQKHILVLGTEEFMYPGLYFGQLLEQTYPDSQVRFHATTRSPILPAQDPQYPLHSRHQMQSFYDDQRTTFLYNLASYDEVFLITDAACDTGVMNALCDLLRSNYHCGNITKVIWSKEK